MTVKIMIMTDMEGCAGVLNHDDWVISGGEFYHKGIRLLTGEVNAAIGGFFAAGAEDIVVVDGHGAGGLDPEFLDERALLQHGRCEVIYPWGVDNTFSALAFVGQHAKAGTPYSHITHTGWFNVIDRQVNGISIGEYGNLALCAMELGIPTIFASGEQALCEEAEALTPGVVTVSVKYGLLTDGLESLNTDEYKKAKLSAVHLSPVKARQLIREGAKSALIKLKSRSGGFSYPDITPPYTLVEKLRKTENSPAKNVTYKHKSSIISLMNLKYD